MLWQTKNIYNWILLKTPTSNIKNNNNNFYDNLEYDSENSNNLDLNNFSVNYLQNNNLKHSYLFKKNKNKKKYSQENTEVDEDLNHINISLLVNKNKFYVYNELKKFTFFKNTIWRFNKNKYFIDSKKLKLSTFLKKKIIQTLFYLEI